MINKIIVYIMEILYILSKLELIDLGREDEIALR
jgi:hypothetical protein